MSLWPTSPGEPFHLEGPTDRPATLLLHGLTGSPFCMRPLAAALHKAGYAVHVPRLPGHGTTPEALNSTSRADWSEAALEAAKPLAEAHSGLIVAGLSMGALLAIELALYKHPIVSALVLLAPALQVSRSAQLKLAAYKALRRPARLALVPKSARRYRTEEDPAYRVHPMNAVLEFDALRREIRGRIELISQPLFLAHGAHDDGVPLSASFEIAQRASSRVNRTVVLRRSQHIITLDLEHEQLEREVLAFLASLG